MRVTLSRAGSGRIIGLVVVGVLAGGMLGCAPEPEPTPTPTAAFASEEEAFAAAEEVYRAYIDAFNAVDFQDPETFEPLKDYVGGDYAANERKQLSEMHAEGYVRGGAIEILTFEGREYSSADLVLAFTCNDVSSTTFVSSSGENLVPEDRTPVSALELSFTYEDDRLLLTAATATESPSCVAS